MAGIDETRQFVPLKIAVLTVSDTRAPADDKSGATLAERIEKAGHAVAGRAIVTDDVEQIRAQVRGWIADPAIDVVITTGGTGFTGRDVTPEALEPLFEKRMDGFSTMFLMVSAQKIGTSAIQTRATAGVAGATYISVCRARPAPAVTPGTRSWCTSSTTATGRAISSRSCRGSTSICAAPRPRARRSTRSVGELIAIASQPGSMPLALSTGTAAGALRKLMKALAASVSLVVAPMPAANTT
jgi:molybdenum cofactor biosynthesis protein B